jgi:hypothetical protein
MRVTENQEYRKVPKIIKFLMDFLQDILGQYSKASPQRSLQYLRNK